MYIGTQYILKEIPSILDLIIVLFPENDLTIPKYRAEERVYLQLRYLAQSSKELIVETHSPEAPILRAFFDGNYRDFTTHTLRERKRFNYPPYSSLAYIHISDTQVSRIEDIGAKILNKLQLTHTAL